MTQHINAPIAETRIESTMRKVVPGVPFTVGVWVRPPAGWHTYYSNPGENGQATKISWNLPPGFKASAIIWPKPERILDGDIASYGYRYDVWLLTEITPPNDVVTGRAYPIGAKVSWLLCKNACVPQSTTLELTLTGAPASGGPVLQALSEAILRQPERKHGLKSKAQIFGGSVVLTLDDPWFDVNLAEFYPANPNFFGTDLPEFRRVEGSLTVKVPISKSADSQPNVLAGILFDGQRTLWIETPIR